MYLATGLFASAITVDSRELAALLQEGLQSRRAETRRAAFEALAESRKAGVKLDVAASSIHLRMLAANAQ